MVISNEPSHLVFIVTNHWNWLKNLRCQRGFWCGMDGNCSPFSLQHYTENLTVLYWESSLGLLCWYPLWAIYRTWMPRPLAKSPPPHSNHNLVFILQNWEVWKTSALARNEDWLCHLINTPELRKKKNPQMTLCCGTSRSAKETATSIHASPTVPDITLGI